VDDYNCEPWEAQFSTISARIVDSLFKVYSRYVQSLLRNTLAFCQVLWYGCLFVEKSRRLIDIFAHIINIVLTIRNAELPTKQGLSTIPTASTTIDYDIIEFLYKE
jgi:hypothetical protein